VLGSQNRFVSLRIARFIGKMVGKRSQGFYIDGAATSLKNINSFLKRTECRGDLSDITCSQGRMVGNDAQESQLRVEPPFLSAFCRETPAFA
jgi:hypothetical protein